MSVCIVTVTDVTGDDFSMAGFSPTKKLTEIYLEVGLDQLPHSTGAILSNMIGWQYLLRTSRVISVSKLN